jgi:hypothetical protein
VCGSSRLESGYKVQAIIGWFLAFRPIQDAAIAGRYLSGAFVLALLGGGCDSSPKAIASLLAAFESHPVVALGEGLHGNEQAHLFRLALIRDPRFPLVVNDIVVEFGTSRYQPVMDAFIRGEEVPAPDLRKTWRDTMKAGAIWDRPIYEEFFRAIRTVRNRIERDDPESVFSIWTNTTAPLELLDSRVSSWPVPRLVAMRGTDLGRLNFSVLGGVPSKLRVEEQYDAVLYLGPPSSITISELPIELCQDGTYMRMRAGRLALVPGGAREVESFQNDCAQRLVNRRPFTRSRAVSGVPDSPR